MAIPVFRGKYPRYTSDFADIVRCIEEMVLPGCLPSSPLISPKTIVRTQGSCFAQNLANALTARGVDVKMMGIYEWANTPRQNADILADVYKKRGPEYESLKKDDLFILTLGVANGSVSECGEALSSIVTILREINPKIAIVLTVSPVPLNRSLGLSAVIEDCVSKSTLRVVAHEFMQRGMDNVYYWPSFEIVRWLGAHTGPAYGADDGLHRHVNLALVDLIVGLFLKHYGTDELRAISPVSLPQGS